MGRRTKEFGLCGAFQLFSIYRHVKILLDVVLAACVNVHAQMRQTLRTYYLPRPLGGAIAYLMAGLIVGLRLLDIFLLFQEFKKFLQEIKYKFNN